MKIVTEPQKFHPVNLVLETQEEVQFLYDLFNFTEVDAFALSRGLYPPDIRSRLKRAGAEFNPSMPSIQKTLLFRDAC